MGCFPAKKKKRKEKLKKKKDSLLRGEIGSSISVAEFAKIAPEKQ